jgi:hypothetical protein
VISGILAEAWNVYRRLWRRSVVVAGLVFVVVELGAALANSSRSVGPVFVSLILSVLGSLLVQGALVEVVRDLHEGREPASIGDYYARTRGVLGTLLGVSVLAAIGVAAGFILIIVPGLILLARWSLVVPLVVLEGKGVEGAFSRSNALVRGRTGRILALVIVAELLSGIAGFGIHYVFLSFPRFWALWVGGTVASAVTAPYTAHVLTVLYYRLTEPESPVLPPAPKLETWQSIWDEEPPK